MLTDPKFRYRPSYATDIRKTFARIAREQKAREQLPAPTPTPEPEPAAIDPHVVPMRKRSAR